MALSFEYQLYNITRFQVLIILHAVLSHCLPNIYHCGRAGQMMPIDE